MLPDTTPADSRLHARARAVAFGPFVFDTSRRLLRRDGVDLPLPPRVIGVLELLLSRPGDVVPRQELLDAVWKDAFVTDTSLAEAVSFLRQALGDDPQAPAYIQTIHRRGYRFLAPVTGDAGLRDAPLPERTRGHTPSVAAESKPAASVLLAWIVAVLCFLAAASAGWYATQQQPVEAPVVQLPLDAGPGRIFDPRAPAIAVSPSGSTVAWCACTQADCGLFIRPVSSLAPHAVAGTSGASAPFFSPDERWVGFFADGKLKKVLVEGGPATVVAEAPQPLGAAWMPDGRIVFAASMAGGLLRVAERGGAVEVLTRPLVSAGELRHVYPSATRKGDAVVFVAVTSPLDEAQGRLSLLPYGNGRASGAWRTLAENVRIGAVVGDEFVAFVRGHALFAQRYDPVRQTSAPPEQLVGPAVLAPHLTAGGGALAHAVDSGGDEGSTGARWTWDGAAAALPAGAELPVLLDASLSPDGTRVAGIGRESEAQVWVGSLARGTTTRLTYGTPAASPVWSTDGTRLFYASQRGGGYEIWTRQASADGDEQRVLAVRDRHLFPSSAAHGHIAYVETGGGSGADIGIVDPGSGVARTVASTRFDEAAPAISPDGALIAYQTDESGQWEIALVHLQTGKRTPVSSGGGTHPFWGPDGRVLFFENRGVLMRVPVSNGGEAIGAAVTARRLDEARPAGVSPAGTLLLQRTRQNSGGTAVLTLQWIRELRRIFGPPPVPLPR